MVKFDENYQEMLIMLPLLSYINSRRRQKIFPNQSQFDRKNNKVFPIFFRFYENLTILSTYTWYFDKDYTG